jgi:hypothetical protein
MVICAFVPGRRKDRCTYKLYLLLESVRVEGVGETSRVTMEHTCANPRGELALRHRAGYYGCPAAKEIPP